jgi:hypothetical protein
MIAMAKIERGKKPITPTLNLRGTKYKTDWEPLLKEFRERNKKILEMLDNRR